MLSEIPPVSKARLKLYGKLHQKKHRDAEGLFLAEGFRTVHELLDRLPDGGMLHALLFREGEPVAGEFLRDLPGKGFTLTEKECRQLSQTVTPSGVFGVFLQQRPAVFSPERVVGRSSLVALDDVQDPGNVGTILRTAAWFGVDALVCGSGTADRYNAKAVRSSAGSIYALSHYSVDSLESELRRLAACGYTIAASSLEGRDFREFGELPDKVVLVVGNEANGVAPEIQALSHLLLKIPHAGRTPMVESLNAAVSAGILMERLVLR